MKTVTKRILFVVAGLGLTTSLVMASSNYYQQGCGQPGDRMVKKISYELELNPDQHQKLVALKGKVQGARQQFRAAHGDFHTDALKLLEESSLDRNKAISMINTRADAVRSNAPQVVDAAGDFYDSLNTEQRKKLREKISERSKYRGRFMKHHGKHHDEDDDKHEYRGYKKYEREHS